MFVRSHFTLILATPKPIYGIQYNFTLPGTRSCESSYITTTTGSDRSGLRPCLDVLFPCCFSDPLIAVGYSHQSYLLHLLTLQKLQSTVWNLKMILFNTNLLFHKLIGGPKIARLPSQMLCWDRDPTIQHPQYTNYSWWLQSIWTLYIQCDTIVTSDVLIQRSEWSCHLNTKYIFIRRYWFGFQAGNINSPARFAPLNNVKYRGSGQSAVTCNLLPSTSRVQVLSKWVKVHGVAETTVAWGKKNNQPSSPRNFIWKTPRWSYDNHIWSCVYTIICVYVYVLYDYIWLYMIVYSTITYKLLNKKEIFPSKGSVFCFRAFMSFDQQVREKIAMLPRRVIVWVESAHFLDENLDSSSVARTVAQMKMAIFSGQERAVRVSWIFWSDVRAKRWGSG